MPAINLARLKQQSNQLVVLYDQPDKFVYELHTLFDLYADRTHRPGQAGEPPSLIKTYYVPKPVVRQILNDLTQYVDQYPIEILTLSDRLWAEPFLEFRLLAIALVGLIRNINPEVVMETINNWLGAQPESRVMLVLLDQGLASMRRYHPLIVQKQIDNWLESSKFTQQAYGLRTLIPFLSASPLNDLPKYLRALTPFVRVAPLPIRPDIVEALRHLARRSPKETSYFLRSNLEVSDNPDTASLIRQILGEFPDDIQENLRVALRQRAVRMSG